MISFHCRIVPSPCVSNSLSLPSSGTLLTPCLCSASPGRGVQPVLHGWGTNPVSQAVQKCQFSSSKVTLFLCLFVFVLFLFSCLPVFKFYHNISSVLSTCCCSASSSCFHVCEGRRETLLFSCSQERNTSLGQHVPWRTCPMEKHSPRRTQPLGSTSHGATHPFFSLSLAIPVRLLLRWEDLQGSLVVHSHCSSPPWVSVTPTRDMSPPSAPLSRRHAGLPAPPPPPPFRGAPPVPAAGRGGPGRPGQPWRTPITSRAARPSGAARRTGARWAPRGVSGGARGDRSSRSVPEQPLGIDSEHSPEPGASSGRILEYSPRGSPRLGSGASPGPSRSAGGLRAEARSAGCEGGRPGLRRARR